MFVSFSSSKSLKAQEPQSLPTFINDDKQNCCFHVDYPCRFIDQASMAQALIPHRIFAPSCLLNRAESTVLPLLPLCLAAAHTVLGVHPFSHLDVLIVPPGFSSLGMAR